MDEWCGEQFRLLDQAHVLQLRHDDGLGAGDFPGDGVGHCDRAASVVLAGHDESGLGNANRRADKFNHTLGQHFPALGIVQGAIGQHP